MQSLFYTVLVCLCVTGGYSNTTESEVLDSHANIVTVNVTKGRTAYLSCNAQSKSYIMQSWSRGDSEEAVSIGWDLLVEDQRIQPWFDPSFHVWYLEIKNTKLNDSGAYHCRLDPHYVLTVMLNVIKPETEILEGPQIYVRSGEDVILSCVVKGDDVPPGHLQWLKDGSNVTFQDQRIRKFSTYKDKGPSHLVISQSSVEDSGKYECVAKRWGNSSVLVHVEDYASASGVMKNKCSLNVLFLYSVIPLTQRFLWKYFSCTSEGDFVS